MHFSFPSLTSIRRHSALSPPTLHGWPHLRKRVRAEKKRGPSVVQTQTSGFYGSLTVLSWLQECVDCVTEVVVVGVASRSVSNTRGSQAAGPLCCCDLMEISRRLLKRSEARHPYKDWIERYERRKRKDKRQRDESYLESFERLVLSFSWSGSCGSLIGFPMFLSRVSYRQKCIISLSLSQGLGENERQTLILNITIYCRVCCITYSAVIHQGFITPGTLHVWSFIVVLQEIPAQVY